MRPEEVIPESIGDAVKDLPDWFVIGGQAVRCLCPYRPSRDVDFGVDSPKSAEGLVRALRRKGKVEILEQSEGTWHLLFNGTNVSIFVLDTLIEFTEERRLSVEGILATKLKAILGRGTRRDFFDLYVCMQMERRGIADCLAAMRSVYRQPLNESLLLRALTYFADAEKEVPLVGEGKRDWAFIKEFFLTRVGKLLVPPERPLEIQSRRVDVRGGDSAGGAGASRAKKPTKSRRRLK